MKYCKLLILAIAGLTLAVMTSGTAFASSWSGTENSHLTSGSSASWVSSINQNIGVSNGVYLTWDNQWVNSYSGSAYYGLQYSSAYAGSADWYSSDTVSYGGGSKTHQMQSSQTTSLPYNGYTDVLNNNHIYKPTSGNTWYGTDFNTNQKFFLK